MKKKTKKILSGMTLIEMIMAIGIFVVGIEGFTLLFYHTWKSNAYTLRMGQSTMAVSYGLDKMVDYVRRARQGDDGSYPIISANGNDMVFFCDYDKDSVAERLHLYKSGEDILLGITEPTNTIPKTYPAGDQETAQIITHIVNPVSVPVFSYYNSDYPADTLNNPLTTPAPVSQLRLVKISLEINILAESGHENTRMQSFVEMRNLSDYNQIQ